MKNIILSIVFTILTIGNIYAIIFVHVPYLRIYNKTSSWLGMGLSIGAIVTGSMQLGKLLYILSTN